ncbi:MAG: hypothetical protein A3J38_00780 [Gammaproteobacteria bacterium RIFCSPHIGHO2_12_FULL_45_9]|nr:MAG: hypothetical protein A3J38_00780 [Gammaproteobacteria bacterium RIFCSPHIGHO2_12_FULL_45_9]
MSDHATQKSVSRVIAALILGSTIGVGTLYAGYFMGKSFLHAKLSENRVITVKGIAEREVRSDLGVLEINYRDIGKDLVTLYHDLNAHQTTVLSFLKQQGFQENEISLQPVRVEDRFANVYDNSVLKGSGADTRYVVTGGVQIRSNHVDMIARVNQQTGSLLQQGVPLAFGVSTLNPNPSYYFTQLDAIRPALLTEATRSAHVIATQFANDMHCQLDKIQHANQGQFQVMARDAGDSGWSNPQGTIIKQVRVVTTLDYRLQ